MTEPAGRRSLLDRLRRVLRGRRATPYKSPQEIALENAAESLGATVGEYYPDDRELDELVAAAAADDPRAEAARHELLAYVASIRARRQRGRRARIAWIVAGGCTLVAIGVVVALVSAERGEDVLSARERHALLVGQPTADGSPTTYYATLPAPGTRVTASLPFGDVKLVSTSYLNNNGDLCSDVTEVRGAIAEQRGGGGCPGRRRVLTDLRVHYAMPYYVQTRPGAVVLGGFASLDVVRITGHSRWGRVRVALTRPWKPSVRSGVPQFSLKAFLVVAETGTGRRIDGATGDLMLRHSSYNLRATLRNGREVPIGRDVVNWHDQRHFIDPIPPSS
jgi:hypothetical protein